jgi:hypothetical protein
VHIEFIAHRQFAALFGIFFLLTCAILGADICKWVDDQGVTHYAERCPEEVESEPVEIQPPPTEAQQEAARQRSEALLQSRQATTRSRDSSSRQFRSLPADRLGPLPENTTSKYLRTTGTGLRYGKNNRGRFTLMLETLDGLASGAYLEVHFPDPSNPARENIVGKVVETENGEMWFESPESDQFRCWNYEILVNVYRDSTKADLLDTHSQFVQSVYDLTLFEDDRPYLLQMVEGPKCPSGRKENLSRMSVEQLEALCEQEREKRLKPERERLIKQCIEKMGRSKEYCTTFYADHGDEVRINRFQVRPALYYDLPECVAAREARDAEK